MTLANGICPEYLEIKSRVQVLNERCRVFLDLAEILSDSIADQKMSSMSLFILACHNSQLSFSWLTRTNCRHNLDYHRPDHSLDRRHLFRSVSAIRHPVYQTQELISVRFILWDRVV